MTKNLLIGVLVSKNIKVVGVFYSEYLIVHRIK